MNDETADMLNKIFVMQADLNDYVFKRNGIVDNHGEILTMAAIFNGVNNEQFKVNELPNRWLGNYSRAMREEINELDADLLWKWWSRDEIDLQNIRVELVDILHFLVSAMICAGLTAEKVFDVYQQKHSVNLIRQDSGYNMKSKTENDNQNIK